MQYSSPIGGEWIEDGSQDLGGDEEPARYGLRLVVAVACPWHVDAPRNFSVLHSNRAATEHGSL